ncbi:MAG TPA: DNA repair protein RecO [Nitrospiraceae bacterium]|jgi:DNA repair protein RecO (recombination protein O)|nr:DNA repair protein RecO [Nitrospiraceae bacterium]
MPLLKTPAVTLKSRRWGEADRIVTFYTLRFGKIRGVARGARRIKSRFGCALEPFVACDLNLFEKPHDSLYRITQADIREVFPPLRDDLTVMSAAARLANLVSAITPEGDSSPAIFETILEGFRALASEGDPLLTALLFQIRLLGEAGFRPQTDHCTGCNGEVVHRERPVLFSPQSGGLVCDACSHRYSGRCLPLSPASRGLLHQARRWAPPLLLRLKASPPIRVELEAAIDAYATMVAGKYLPPTDFLAAEPAPSRYRATLRSADCAVPPGTI